MYDGCGSFNSQFLDEVVDVTAVLCAEQYSSLTIPREISDRRGALRLGLPCGSASIGVTGCSDS